MEKNLKSLEEIKEVEKTLLKLGNLNASFDYLQIRIASPTRIRNWSEKILPSGEVIGEVLRGETINFRTHQPELNGLFCEKIFGPVKNWKCKCGKYNGYVHDKICEDCQVEIIESRVRRYRMGYIDLTCPIAHIWYFKGVPNYLSVLLKCFSNQLKITHLEEIIYFQEGEYILSTQNPLYPFFRAPKTAEENELENLLGNPFDPDYLDPFNKRKVKKRCGAEILKLALESIDLKKEITKSRDSLIHCHLGHFIDSVNLSEKVRLENKTLIRRIRIFESFFATKTNPSWLILTVLPVLPPHLRPLVELDNGRLVAADVNEIYRIILTRNDRLYDFFYNFIPPDLITLHGRKLLQEAVDSLIDNSRLSKEKALHLNNKALKSLTEILEGKQGRFRQSLLGKRVDYSGRSVIVVGPTLRLNQCGLPYEMAKELFQPFLINEILKTKTQIVTQNTKIARLIIKKNKPFLWRLLEFLTLNHAILLNRAPTLHRFGIQAFDPLLVLGQAIHLHPLVCTGFNADFDGDQMAIHVPLYEASQLEARTMMRPSYNVLSPSNGEVILKPTQDMVIGSYYLTLMINKTKFSLQKWFSNEQQALSAYYQKNLSIHTSILVRYDQSNFQIKMEKDHFEFIDLENKLKTYQKPIYILKEYKVGKNINKFYWITTIGVLIGYLNEDKTYNFTTLFLETTPGRLLFSINFKNSIKKRQDGFNSNFNKKKFRELSF
jgi:DNA-directed RNA polymerase subunit beta'